MPEPKQPKQAAANTVDLIALVRIEHDGKVYEIDEPLTATEAAAASLIEVGAAKAAA